MTPAKNSPFSRPMHVEPRLPASTLRRMPWADSQRGCWIGCLLLAAGTLAVYWQVARFDFVNFDDPPYVTDNVHVRTGITWANLNWVWTAIVDANWHPVTMLSHMLDCQLYGPAAAGGHHMTNLLLHVANSWLLFALMLRMTGRPGPSFAVAALFAWHPLHVESVAWIAERKDVLSAFFFLLTLLFYTRYARPRDSASTIRNYCLTLLFFVLGLMSKPMLVTLPFLLLLLDYWPLKRIAGWGVRSAESKEARQISFGRAILEKLPFLLLSAISSGMTLWAQNAGGAVVEFRTLPLGYRLDNAVLSYYRYIGKTFWPARLAAFYPYTGPESSLVILIAGLALVIFSIIVLRLKKFPYLATGWLWYAGALVPVIGLVQVGDQAIADRYMYLPSIGLFILVVFGLSDLAARFGHGTPALVVMAGLAFAACLAATRQQVSYWRNSESLFRHAIEAAPNNYVAYYNLGFALEGKKEFPEALEWYRKAAECGDSYGQNSLGAMYEKGQGVGRDYAEALKWFRKSAEQGNPAGQENLAYMYVNGLGVDKDYAEAVKWFRKSAEQGTAYAQNNLGWMYVNGLGVDKDYVQAVKWFRKSADQGNPGGQNNLGGMYENGNGVDRDIARAIQWYRQAAAQDLPAAEQNLRRLNAGQ